MDLTTVKEVVNTNQQFTGNVDGIPANFSIQANGTAQVHLNVSLNLVRDTAGEWRNQNEATTNILPDLQLKMKEALAEIEASVTL